MGWHVIIELVLQHEYYVPHAPPVKVRAADENAFRRAGLLLRQSGATASVLTEEENTDLPAVIALDLEAQNQEVVAVTEGADWRWVPKTRLNPGQTKAWLDPGARSDLPQVPGFLRLAQIEVKPNVAIKQCTTVQFSAVSSHWTYHVLGAGNQEVLIEDTDGEIAFEVLDMTHMPDGQSANVIRSQTALPSRARPSQRFSLSRPGPFGPQILIPILPAPPPIFTIATGPDGAGTVTQSDIYVSIP